MKSIKTGDVFLLPLEDKYFISAKIIWVSKKFKSAIGFVFLPKIYKKNQDIEIEEGEYKTVETYTGFDTIIYGYGTNVRKGIWPIVGELPLNKLDEELIYHIVGQNLYKGDEFIKELGIDEHKKHHNFDLGGDQAVLNDAYDAFKNDIEEDKELVNIETLDSPEVADAKVKGSYP